MEWSLSSEVNSSLAIQGISHNLWNSNVHYHVHNSLPLIPDHMHMDLIHPLPLASVSMLPSFYA